MGKDAFHGCYCGCRAYISKLLIFFLVIKFCMAFLLCSFVSSFALLLFDPHIGIANTVENPHRYVGWLFTCL